MDSRSIRRAWVAQMGCMRGREVEKFNTKPSRKLYHARALMRTLAFTLAEAGSHHRIFSKGERWSDNVLQDHYGFHIESRPQKWVQKKGQDIITKTSKRSPTVRGGGGLHKHGHSVVVKTLVGFWIYIAGRIDKVWNVKNRVELRMIPRFQPE